MDARSPFGWRPCRLNVVGSGMVKDACFVLQNCSLRSLESPRTRAFSHVEQNRKMLVARSFHHARWEG